mmetsp:Transcript_3943/g.10191  ORF Transcript_3943/g.10191 Transcript_3943/m.10191 type:complete len:243 (+) Transcript_3943:494-1222(+)
MCRSNLSLERTCTKRVAAAVEPAPLAESPAAAGLGPPSPAARRAQLGLESVSSSGSPKCTRCSCSRSAATHLGELTCVMPCRDESAETVQPSFTCTKYCTASEEPSKPCAPTSSPKAWTTIAPRSGRAVNSTPPRFFRAISSWMRAARSARRSPSVTMRSARLSSRKRHTLPSRATRRYHSRERAPPVRPPAPLPWISSPTLPAPSGGSAPSASRAASPSGPSSSSTPSLEKPGVMSRRPLA